MECKKQDKFGRDNWKHVIVIHIVTVEVKRFCKN